MDGFSVPKADCWALVGRVGEEDPVHVGAAVVALVKLPWPPIGAGHTADHANCSVCPAESTALTLCMESGTFEPALAFRA